MSDRPLVSVVMIFLDAKSFIREAIESVLAQTHENWELILVDDGSTDGSTEVAREYAAKHSLKIRYMEHDGHANRGMSASRNAGMEQSRGEFIALLDADDVWLPEKLTKQVTLLRANPEAAMVYGPAMNWHSWNGGSEDVEQQLGVDAGVLYRPPYLAEMFLWDDRRSPRTCSVLMRKGAVQSVGGFESRFRGMFEDQAFFQKLCVSKRVYVMSECLDKYRQHPQSCTRSIQLREYFAKRAEFLGWLNDYLEQNRIAHQGVQEALAFSLSRAQRPDFYRIVDPLLSQLRPIRRFAKQASRAAMRVLVPVRFRRWIWSFIAEVPPVGAVRFGDLRQLKPISANFGYDRGKPVDRYYIESFLAENTADIKGRVLEIGDNEYTVRFGGARVTKSEVLNVVAGFPGTTIVGDITRADNHIPSDAFDCIIFTQTLEMIYDQRTALRNLYRILKPGGVLLGSSHGATKIARHRDIDPWGQYWHLTVQSAQLLFEEFFPAPNVNVRSWGNVLTAISSLMGLSATELTSEELNFHDRDFEVIITIRAAKPERTS